MIILAIAVPFKLPSPPTATMPNEINSSVNPKFGSKEYTNPTIAPPAPANAVANAKESIYVELMLIPISMAPETSWLIALTALPKLVLKQNKIE